MKTIVTHISPDIDAITSVWLIHRFYPGWAKAAVVFVPAGETLGHKDPDNNPSVIHVDTGLGKFDHHQTADKTCAAEKVFEFLELKRIIKESFGQPLRRLTSVVCDIDHFQEVYLSKPDADMYNFLLISIVDGLKIKIQNDDQIVPLVETLLDAILQSFFNKVRAELDIEKGIVFNTRWGKAMGLLTENEESLRLAQKKGFALVARKSPKQGTVRVKILPNSKKSLKKVYEALMGEDPKATWFFHKSGHMVLNGSSKNPNSKPTKLSLSRVIEILKTAA